MMMTLGLILALQDPPPNHQEHLKRLEFLIGSWTGKGKSPQGEFEEDVSFEWSHGRNFVRHTSVMKSGGKTAWTFTGMIGWDADQKKLSEFFFGLDGRIGWGVQADEAPKDDFTLEGRAAGPDRVLPFRVRVRKAESDRLSITHYSEKDGKTQETGTILYDRRKDKPEEPPAPTGSERMKPFEFLAGSWTGTAQLGDMKVVEETTYEWVQGGHFLRTSMKITSEGQVVYTATGMIGWDVEKKKYIWFHFGMEGSIGWSTGDAPVKDAFVIEGALRGDPTVKDYRMKYTILGRDKYAYEMEIKQGDAWVPFLAATAERRK